MVNFIKRHVTPADNWDSESIKNFNLGFERDTNYLKELVNNTQFASSIAQDFSRYANNGEYLKRDKTEIFQFLFYAHQFALASAKWEYSEKALVTIGKKQVEFEGRNKSLSEQPNAEELQKNLQIFIPLALVMRDEQAKKYYNSLELVYTKRIFYIVASDFLFSKLFSLMCAGDIVALKKHLSFLVSFQENEYAKKKTRDTNVHYQKDFKADNFSIYSSNYVPMRYEGEQIKYLKLPFLAVLQSVLEENETDFNKNLLIALESHKKYYGTCQIEGETIHDKPEGWVSLWLTCACAIAHDKGMKREVTSDYIPEWLVKGEFEGLELVVE